MNARNLRVGSKGGQFGIEMVTFENGGIAKSIHGDLYKNSIWYTLYGSKGRAESAREDAENGDVSRVYLNVDEYDGEYPEHDRVQTYQPKDALSVDAQIFGHGGSDFYSMYHFVEKIRGDESADVIDVYEALDMFLPGLFAYRSILAGGAPMAIPDLRDKAVREQYRDDTACTDPKVAGDRLLPTAKLGTPAIDPGVYPVIRQRFLDDLAAHTGYSELAFTQGTKKQEK